jgi:hypothetical protein
MEKKELWIGLAIIKPYPTNTILNGAKEAFVNVISPAQNISNFAYQVEEALKILGFELNEIEDAEKFYQRIKEHEVEDCILELAQEVEKTDELKFGNFHIYK